MLDRRVWSWGALVAVAALATTAMTVDAEEIDVRFAGRDDFDIVVAGDRDPEWVPTPADWVQGNPDAYTILLTEDGARPQIGPGGTLSLRIAARNATPELPAIVGLTVSDPDVHTGETHPVTGRPVELFEQLRFTVRDGDTVLVDDIAGDRIADASYAWPTAWAPGETHVLDVSISLPEHLGNEWQDAASAVQFSFEAIND